jgi:hypothetical protein
MKPFGAIRSYGCYGTSYHTVTAINGRCQLFITILPSDDAWLNPNYGELFDNFYRSFEAMTAC